RPCCQGPPQPPPRPGRLLPPRPAPVDRALGSAPPGAKVFGLPRRCGFERFALLAGDEGCLTHRTADLLPGVRVVQMQAAATGRTADVSRHRSSPAQAGPWWASCFIAAGTW